MATLKEINTAFKRKATLPATKMDYNTFRKLRVLKAQTVGQKSWADYFRFLTNNVNIEPTLHERVAMGTKQNLLKPWMYNFAENIANIRYGDCAHIYHPPEYKQTSILDLVEREPLLEGDPLFLKENEGIYFKAEVKVKFPPTSSAVVIGRGPSLFSHDHLKQLADAQEKGYNGLVVASDGGLIPALEKGVRVDVVVSVDGDPVIKKWYDHPLVKEHGKEIKCVASVTIHHDVYLAARAAKMPVYWFNPMFDDWRQNESWTKLQRLLSRTNEFPFGVPGLNTGGHSGGCAWITAMEIFQRAPVALIGLDLGYPQGTPIEQTQYYQAILAEAGGDSKKLEACYPKYFHPVFKTWAYADFIFNHYRLAMIELQQETKLWYRLYGGTHNCSEQGTLFGPGITCIPFKQFLAENMKI